jgi:DNA-binding PadR family transcriptional regulator
MPATRPTLRLNDLALTALHLLHERAMHPYEMGQVIRRRHIDEILGLKRGSLYHAIDRLVRDGLVEAAETSREGRRPERTVYRLTEAGREAFEDHLRDLLAEARYEPTSFTAAVQFLTSLEPEAARPLLERRLLGLELIVARFDSALALDLPRAVLLESEYARALYAAELEWVRGVVADLREGRLTWPARRSCPA